MRDDAAILAFCDDKDQPKPAADDDNALIRIAAWWDEEDPEVLHIEWDENDPRAAVINTWTEQDWLDALTESANKILAKHDDDDA